MAFHSVLLSTILAFSLASTERCVSSPGSSTDLSLRSQQNASGHWIIMVDTRRLIRKDNPREFSVNVQHETRICARYEIEERVSMAFVYSSLHDTLIPGANQSSTTRPTTTPPTTTTTTTSTTAPKSCPHSQYRLYEGFNSCYKAFRFPYKTWSEARERCKRDGGDLMVIDSERERREVFFPMRNSGETWGYDPWVGVYIPPGRCDWTTVKGEPTLSTWWDPGYPKKNTTYMCAVVDFTGRLMNIQDCEAASTFICEISL